MKRLVAFLFIIATRKPARRATGRERVKVCRCRSYQGPLHELRQRRHRTLLCSRLERDIGAGGEPATLGLGFQGCRRLLYGVVVMEINIGARLPQGALAALGSCRRKVG